MKPESRRAVASCYVVLCGAALAALLLVYVLPGAGSCARSALRLNLAGVPPRKIGTVATLVIHNASAALWPLALVALGLARVPVACRAFDVVVAASLLANGAIVGAAFAAYGLPLLPYVVQLPVEWLALACGAAGWLIARTTGDRSGMAIRGLQVAGVATVAAAAVLEVYATAMTV